MSICCWGENQNLKTNKQMKSKQQSLAGILYILYFYVSHLRFENRVYRLWHSFVWLLGLLIWLIGYAETEAHSTADIQISQTINYDESVPSSGLWTDWFFWADWSQCIMFCFFFAMWSAAQSTPLLWVSQYECLRPGYLLLLWVTTCWLSKAGTFVVVIRARTRCTASHKPLCISKNGCWSTAEQGAVLFTPNLDSFLLSWGMKIKTN